MKQDSSKLSNRRRFLTGMGVVATTATLATAARAAENHNHDEHHGFTPARHPEDSWMGDMPGVHRAFIDSSTGPGGVGAVNFATNILSAHGQGYGGSDSDYGMIVCFRHDSSPFGFNNAMWEKYGELFSSRTGVYHSETNAPLTVNPLNLEQSPYGNRSNTTEKLANRGVHFAICNLSTGGMAGMLARSTGGSRDDIYQELISNSVANGRFVPAGVVAATRAQEYGYSLLYSA